MSSPWGKIEKPEPVNLKDIMSEQLASDMQSKEDKKVADRLHIELNGEELNRNEPFKDKMIIEVGGNNEDESSQEKFEEAVGGIEEIIKTNEAVKRGDTIKRYEIDTRNKAVKSKETIGGRQEPYVDKLAAQNETYEQSRIIKTKCNKNDFEAGKTINEFELPEDGSCESDEVIASMLQKEFDREYDEMLTRSEKKYNASSKVGISFNNYRRSNNVVLGKQYLQV